MSKDNLYEMPFEYLKRKNGEAFDPQIIQNWYIARRFVLEKFKEMKIGFGPKSEEHLHVVVDGNTPMMLSIVRQVALTAHFINFQEGDKREEPKNRTVISIVTQKDDILKELEKEEYLCNLPRYCKVVNGGVVQENEGYFIDIEIHILKQYSPDFCEKNVMLFSEQILNDFLKGREDDLLGIDTSKPVYASRIYDLGAELYNIPAEDIHCTERYTLALDIFQHQQLKKSAECLITKKWQNMSLCRVKESLSNIFCSDCFTIREECIIKACGNDYKRTSGIWGKYNEQLSISEHARWVVEKLIMGYRALDAKERYHDEYLHVQYKGKDKKKKFRDSLKRKDNNPAHIDLCSYKDLRRVNPDDLKFDSFLMLAIPMILKKVNE